MATIASLTPAAGTVTRVPGQNTTFAVVASSDFLNATYTYQWFRNSALIPDASTSSYFIDPLMTDTGAVFSVNLSAFSGAVEVDKVNNIATWTLTVQEDVQPYDRLDSGTETGRERFRRLRHLGYI